MRPGAPLSPEAVWQLLQATLVCGDNILRSLPFIVTRAVYGIANVLLRPKKLPIWLLVKLDTTLLASVISMTAPGLPVQRSRSVPEV